MTEYNDQRAAWEKFTDKVNVTHADIISNLAPNSTHMDISDEASAFSELYKDVTDFVSKASCLLREVRAKDKLHERANVARDRLSDKQNSLAKTEKRIDDLEHESSQLEVQLAKLSLELTNTLLQEQKQSLREEKQREKRARKPRILDEVLYPELRKPAQAKRSVSGGPSDKILRIELAIKEKELSLHKVNSKKAALSSDKLRDEKKLIEQKTEIDGLVLENDLCCSRIELFTLDTITLLGKLENLPMRISSNTITPGFLKAILLEKALQTFQGDMSICSLLDRAGESYTEAVFRVRSSLSHALKTSNFCSESELNSVLGFLKLLSILNKKEQAERCLNTIEQLHYDLKLQEDAVLRAKIGLDDCASLRVQNPSEYLRWHHRLTRGLFSAETRRIYSEFDKAERDFVSATQEHHSAQERRDEINKELAEKATLLGSFGYPLERSELSSYVEYLSNQRTQLFSSHPYLQYFSI